MKKLGALILTTFIAMLLCSSYNGFKDDEESNNDEIVIDNIKSVEEKNTRDISQNNNETVTDNKLDKKDTDDLSRQNNELNKLKIIEKVEEMTDEEFLTRYINDIIWEMDFNNALELSTEELFRFFLYSLEEGVDVEEADDKYQYYQDKWWNKETGIFSISEEDITKQLDKYFKEYNFNVSECGSYNFLTEKIELNTITGWGGVVFTKIRNKSIDYNINRVRLTIDYYEDETYNVLKETKEYIFEFYNDGYFLIKCEKI